VGQRRIADAGKLIEELLCFPELSGVEQSDRSRKYAEIVGTLTLCHTIRFAAANGFLLHRYVGESVSDSEGWMQLQFHSNFNPRGTLAG
jgi:hypothetical protein